MEKAYFPCFQDVWISLVEGGEKRYFDYFILQIRLFLQFYNLQFYTNEKQIKTLDQIMK